MRSIINDAPQYELADTRSFEVLPGTELEIDVIVPKVPSDPDNFECLTDYDCELGAICVSAVCVIDVDADRDRDGVPDGTASMPIDNCPDVDNPDQINTDSESGDLLGDDCDDDDDQDGILDLIDNCPLIQNRGQEDADQNGQGNACDKTTNGTSIVGYLFSESADFSLNDVQMFLSLGGEETALVPILSEDGFFNFDQVITVSEDSAFTLRIELAGFDPIEIRISIGSNPASSIRRVNALSSLTVIT